MPENSYRGWHSILIIITIDYVYRTAQLEYSIAIFIAGLANTPFKVKLGF